ncbi:MAG: TetR/AcrR family transcriptional regulator [Actinomycetes bacterium]
MERTRAGIVAGARAGIVRDGVRRVSMATVADLGGVAKATVYNHVRSKPDLLALVAHDLVERVDAVASEQVTLVDALVAAAGLAAQDEVVRAVADEEPGVVGRLMRVQSTPVFDEARTAIAALVERHGVDITTSGGTGTSGESTVDLVLRWLVSVAASPSDDGVCRAQASMIVEAAPKVPLTP